ncbi:hypothetical protein VPH35_031371 [Triticum aestivum]
MPMLRLPRRGRRGDRASCAAGHADVAATRHIRRRRPRELRRGGGQIANPSMAVWNRRSVLLQPARRMGRPRHAASGGARCWDRLRGMLQPWLGDAGTETRRVVIGRPATVILLESRTFFARWSPIFCYHRLVVFAVTSAQLGATI